MMETKRYESIFFLLPRPLSHPRTKATHSSTSGTRPLEHHPSRSCGPPPQIVLTPPQPPTQPPWDTGRNSKSSTQRHSWLPGGAASCMAWWPWRERAFGGHESTRAAWVSSASFVSASTSVPWQVEARKTLSVVQAPRPENDRHVCRGFFPDNARLRSLYASLDSQNSRNPGSRYWKTHGGKPR